MSKRYPEYDPDAKFKCNQGCGTFERQQCHTVGGHLTCPRCRYRATLQFVGRAALEEASK